MTVTVEGPIRIKASEYKGDLEELEGFLQSWRDARVRRIDSIARECLEIFVDLQMDLSKLKHEYFDFYKNIQSQLYGHTHDFICHFQNIEDQSLDIFLAAPQFVEYMDHAGRYCDTMEKELGIENSDDAFWNYHDVVKRLLHSKPM